MTPGTAEHQEAWTEALRRLVDHLHTHGDTLVPVRYRSADGFGLGAWVSTQRQAYRTGTLAADRIAVLEAMDGWSWDGATARADRQWLTGYGALQDFAARTGHARNTEPY